MRWFLSLEAADLPQAAVASGKTTYRSITLDNRELEFSDGFTDLHTESYRAIIEGKGFGLDDVKPAIQTVFEIRNANQAPLRGDYHPFLKNRT